MSFFAALKRKKKNGLPMITADIPDVRLMYMYTHASTKLTHYFNNGSILDR